MFKNGIFIFYFASACCLAQESPSNTLQVEYQQQVQVGSSSYFDIESISQVPQATYQYLNQVFKSFYRSFNFTTSITDSTFVDNAHYQIFSLPIMPLDSDCFEVEVFGNFYDPAKQDLANLNADQAMYDYVSNSEEMNIYESNLAFGAGFSFKAD
ncbi:hypothetical protein [Psychromonas sp. MME2]|uniref:hypothetical protein n=1 Tax=Psychromonas sp. MME2 TaxID=3231033 RepID=UPI00339C633C